MLKDRLKELRKEMGISQYEAARRMGFSRGKLANYEQGSREPDYETLEKLADFYGCTVDYLLGRTDFTTKEDKFLSDIDSDMDIDIKELQKKYSLTIDGKTATKEEIEGAIAFIRSLRGMK